MSQDVPRWKKQVAGYTAFSIVFLVALVDQNERHRWYEAEALSACLAVTSVSVVVCWVRK